MIEPAPDRVALNTETLKGLAHPLRVRLLGELREQGPSTATKLAERLGQSSGATSYHLRQLANYGLVVEDDSQGGGRERWWRAAHRGTLLRREEIREAPLEAEEYLRAVAIDNFRHVDRFVNDVTSLPREWDHASMLSDWLLRLTAAEATELRTALVELAERQRTDPTSGEADAPPDAERVVLQINLMPQLRATAPETHDETE